MQKKMDKVLCSLVTSPGHTLDDHPENPGRFAYFDRLREAPLADYLVWVESEPAALEAVVAVHSPQLLEFLPQAVAQLRQRGAALIDQAPTYVTPESWQAALDAASGALAVSRGVLGGVARRGFALVRPPGHHATRDTAMGFCLLNNLAIAAADALSGVGPGSPRKVAIVDFDAHHGNGTEAIFWDRPQVGFFSFHQEGIYPGSGTLDEAPHARGRLLNLPLPAHTGDGGLREITTQVIAPWLRHFRPEMLFVSAGFDGHRSDPLTTLGFTTAGFFNLARSLADLADELCNGRMVCILEGGYDPHALADNVAAVLGAMAGQPETPGSDDLTPHPEPDIKKRIARLRELHEI
jgi:acetoin utilization deacetylase AcuC-like enzyme